MKTTSKILLSSAILVTISLGISYSVTALAQYPHGLISYWTLNDGTGDTATDVVGANDATVVGAYWTPGIVGDGLSFDGQDDYVIAQNHTLPVRSVEAWVMLSAAPTTYRYGIVAGTAIPGACTWTAILEVDTNRRPSFYHWDGTAVRRPYGTTALNLGEWYHLVGTVGTSEVKMYVNGSLEGTTLTGPATFEWDPNYTVFSFAEECYGGHYSHAAFNGSLDEVAIYDRVLTLEEVLRHYQSGLEGRGYEEAPIPATVALEPNVLNRKSAGNFVTCLIELPTPYLLSDIEKSSIVLEVGTGGSALEVLEGWGEIGDHDDDGTPEMMVKFDRRRILAACPAGDLLLQVSGLLQDGTPFAGTVSVRVR